MASHPRGKGNSRATLTGVPGAGAAVHPGPLRGDPAALVGKVLVQGRGVPGAAARVTTEAR